MIPYILHVTVITTICFLFYKLLLQKETFYRLNRWTLMGCLAVSFALPLLPVPQGWSWRDRWSEPETPVVTAVASDHGSMGEKSNKVATTDESKTAGMVIQPIGGTDEPQGTTGIEPATNNSKRSVQMKRARRAGHTAGIVTPAASTSPGTAAFARADLGAPSITTPSTANTTAGTPVEKKEARTLARFFSGGALLAIVRWVFYCYLFGVVLFGIGFLVQLAVLLYQSYSRPVIRDGRFRIVEIGGNRAPCSFGNTIFINPENYDWETYNQILIHEKIHVSGRHTLDILLAEIALVIQWFNPFVWLYRREVENNLEFLTDAHVLLHRDVERSAYQLSLLRVSAPHLLFSITNNYNQSLLKRRIVMMNSKRSSLQTVWKYFFLIPMLAALMCALNRPTVALAATTNKLPLLTTADTTKKPAKHADEPVPARIHAKTADAAAGNSAAGDSYSEDSKASSGRKDPEAHDNDSYGDEPAARAFMVQDMNAVTINGAYDVRPAISLQPKKFKLQSMSYDMQPMIDAATLSDIDARVNVKPRMPEFKGLTMAGDTMLTDGSWYATSYGDKLSFELKAGDDEHNWNTTLRVDKSEIDPFPGQGTVEFKLAREAGTIVFKGQFDGQEGFGHFHFTPDASYFPALKALGVEDLEDRRQFAFFNLNVKKAYADMVVHSGYPHISQRDLLSFAAMHIDQAFIQLWHGSDIADLDASEPRNLIRLKAMHIDRAYIDELKTEGYDHLNLREIESMKAQGIDRAYIRSIRRGGNQPIPPRDLVTYKAMHIDSNYLSELGKLGYDNLPMREVTILYSQHVTPEYIRGFRDAGYKDLDVRTISRFKAQGITPELIKGFTDLGYTDLNANQLSQLKAMNITPEYVREFNKLGFDNIPVRLLTSLKATGVNAEYVSKMRSQGFVSKDLVKYMRLKNDFN